MACGWPPLFTSFRSFPRSSPRLRALIGIAVGGGAAVWLSCASANTTGPAAAQVTAVPASRWFKGNLHTHTLNSDGDSTPAEVVHWYREHGYDFLVLTDHNVLTDVNGLSATPSAAGSFLVVRGEELTSQAEGKPIHVNGFDVSRLVEPPPAAAVVEMVQGMVDRIRGANGVPSINHPNFGWAIGADELAKVQRTRLFEVYNGHPQANNAGGGGVPGLETVWDRLLSGGTLLYGIAVDDAHHFRRPGDAAASSPGHGWVYVQAPALEPRALLEALEQGRFYASTGVQLEAVEATPAGVRVTVKPTGLSKYRIQFIGPAGRVLAEVPGPDASYAFTGDERYVRAKVFESTGAVAWTQPIGVGAQAPK
jgi:hypothetical protein